MVVVTFQWSALPRLQGYCYPSSVTIPLAPVTATTCYAVGVQRRRNSCRPLCPLPWSSLCSGSLREHTLRTLQYSTIARHFSSLCNHVLYSYNYMSVYTMYIMHAVCAGEMCSCHVHCANVLSVAHSLSYNNNTVYRSVYIIQYVGRSI